MLNCVGEQYSRHRKGPSASVVSDRLRQFVKATVLAEPAHFQVGAMKHRALNTVDVSISAAFPVEGHF